jgi:hypothetical protein
MRLLAGSDTGIGEQVTIFLPPLYPNTPTYWLVFFHILYVFCEPFLDFKIKIEIEILITIVLFIGSMEPYAVIAGPLSIVHEHYYAYM